MRRRLRTLRAGMKSAPDLSPYTSYVSLASYPKPIDHRCVVEGTGVGAEHAGEQNFFSAIARGGAACGFLPGIELTGDREHDMAKPPVYSRPLNDRIPSAWMIARAISSVGTRLLIACSRITR